MSEILLGGMAGVVFAVGWIVGSLVTRRRLTRKVAQAFHETERRFR